MYDFDINKVTKGTPVKAWQNGDDRYTVYLYRGLRVLIQENKVDGLPPTIVMIYDQADNYPVKIYHIHAAAIDTYFKTLYYDYFVSGRYVYVGIQAKAVEYQYKITGGKA